jgi:hypothetical protein
MRTDVSEKEAGRRAARLEVEGQISEGRRVCRGGTLYLAIKRAKREAKTAEEQRLRERARETWR